MPPATWRLEKTSGHGHLADWGIHLIDTTRWILGLGAPVSVASAGGLYHLKGKITTPDILTTHFEFAECPLTWRHRIWGAQDFDAATSNGIFLYGEKETVFCTDNRWVVLPKGREAKPQVHEAQNDSSGLHLAEFLEAVRTRKQPSVSTAEAHLSTTAVKLAMISYETGSSLYRRDWSPTPAATAYRDLVFKQWWTTWRGQADAQGRCEVPAFFGKHRVTAGGKDAVVELKRKEPNQHVSLKQP